MVKVTEYSSAIKQMQMLWSCMPDLIEALCELRDAYLEYCSRPGLAAYEKH